MNISPILKILLVIGALVTGLALSPSIAMADDSGRGKFKNSHSQSAGKHQNKKQHRREHRSDHSRNQHKNQRSDWTGDWSRNHNNHNGHNYSHDRRHNKHIHYRHGHRNPHQNHNAHHGDHGHYRHNHQYCSSVKGYTGNTSRISGHRNLWNRHNQRFSLGIRTNNIGISLHK